MAELPKDKAFGSSAFIFEEEKEGKVMKAAFLFCMVMMTLVIVVPASAQSPVVELYDDFQAKVLDPNKWSGGESSAAGVDVLESGRQIKNEPLFGLRWLDIFNRSYASVASDTERSTAYNRLSFADGSNITTIQATVMVRKIQATACSTNTLATEPRARIGGMYFNRVAGAPEAPGDATNDVRAFIVIRRASDSTNPANELNIVGQVVLCEDADCDTNTQIGTVNVGTAIVNLPVKVRITWEPGNNRFAFQKGKAPEVYINNTVPVGGAPGTDLGGNKRVEVNHQIPNCTSTPRPMAFMEAYFDNIKVNPQ